MLLTNFWLGWILIDNRSNTMHCRVRFLSYFWRGSPGSAICGFNGLKNPPFSR
jgi:hypothetical protein